MNVVVCVKQVPDPNLAAAMDGNRLKRDGPAVLDPGDEYGVEAALQLAEAHGGEVTVVTMGPPKAMEAVRKALSMGAHKAILVSDDSLAGADALLTARVLAAAIKQNPFDVVIAGVESADGYTGTVPGTIAALLDVPQATFARKLEVDGSTLRTERQTASGYDVVETALPALVTVTAGVNEPRYPSFKGIVSAKSRPVQQLSASDLGIQDATPTQQVSQIRAAEKRQGGRVVTDEDEGVAAIVEYLAAVKLI